MRAVFLAVLLACGLATASAQSLVQLGLLPLGDLTTEVITCTLDVLCACGMFADIFLNTSRAAMMLPYEHNDLSVFHTQHLTHAPMHTDRIRTDHIISLRCRQQKLRVRAWL